MKGMRILILILAVLAAVYAMVRLGERREAGPNPLFSGFDPEKAAGIYIEAGGGREAVVLEKREGGWVVPSEHSLPADPTAVASILEKVASFSRNDVVSTNPGNRSLYQVDSAGVFASILDAEGDTLAAFVVGKVGPSFQSSYVRDARSDDVILTPGYLRSMFDRGRRTWQDRLIFSLEPDEIIRVDVRRGEDEFAIARGAGGEWYVSEPERAACKQEAASRLVRTLALLRCDDFAGRLSASGWDAARSDTTLRFTTAGGEEHRLYFGGENDRNQVQVAKDDMDVVYLMGRPRVNTLTPALLDLLPDEPPSVGGEPGDSQPGEASE